MQYDYAPGIPIDCALSRQIRAWIITRQIQQCFDDFALDREGEYKDRSFAAAQRRLIAIKQRAERS